MRDDGPDSDVQTVSIRSGAASVYGSDGSQVHDSPVLMPRILVTVVAARVSATGLTAVPKAPPVLSRESVQIDGGPPEAIPSTIWVAGATQDLEIVEVLPQLVQQ